MKGIISRWILSRIVRSAMVFEKGSIELYRRLQESAEGDLRRDIGHLLDEEEMHWRILTQAAEGKLDITELEKALHQHLYARLAEISPLSPESMTRWEGELSRALEEEKETFIFYSNLRRISKIPAVKRAFEILADMEREHADILSRLLGRDF